MNNIKINIQTLAEKMVLGDIEAKNKLISYYTQIIKDIIEKNFNNTQIEKEDLVQIGIVGILKAIKNYKIEYTYFSRYVLNSTKVYIMREINKSKKHNNSIPIGINFNLNNNKNFVNFVENNALLNKTIKKLPKKYQSILALHFYYNYTFEEIAKMFNLSNSRIREMYFYSLELIKEEMLYYEIFNNLNIKNNKMHLYDFIFLYFYEYELDEINTAISLLSNEKKRLIKNTIITDKYEHIVSSVLRRMKILLNN